MGLYFSRDLRGHDEDGDEYVSQAEFDAMRGVDPNRCYIQV